MPTNWRRQWHPTPLLLPGKSHGQKSLVGCSQSIGSQRVGHDWATSLSCIGEGNGNPLQCSCLENPRDGGAWWAAVYGVAQSRTRLNRLSSSSSMSTNTSSTLDLYFVLLLSILANPPVDLGDSIYNLNQIMSLPTWKFKAVPKSSKAFMLWFLASSVSQSPLPPSFLLAHQFQSLEPSCWLQTYRPTFPIVPLHSSVWNTWLSHFM